MENDFVKQEKKWQADSHLFSVESKNVQKDNARQIAQSGRSTAGADAGVNQERTHVQRVTKEIVDGSGAVVDRQTTHDSWQETWPESQSHPSVPDEGRSDRGGIS